MMTFTNLFLAHLIGDFLLQPDAMVRHKKRHLLRSWYLYLHVAIHGLLSWLLTGNGMVGAITLIAHFCIDSGKLLLTGKANERLLFVADQLAHLLVIFGVITLFDVAATEDWKQLLTSTETLPITCCIVFLTQPASIVIRVMISGWTPSLGYTKADADETPLMSAGKYIGMLERLFVFGFVCTDHFEAIGFLLAAKSIFRFGDLKDAKDRNLTEYVLIGTLLSFGFAIAAGWIYTGNLL